MWIHDKLLVALAPLVVALFCSSFMRMSRFGLAAADVADGGRGLNGTSKDACASLPLMSEIPIRDTCASLEMHMLEMHVHLERCNFFVQGTCACWRPLP